MKWEFIYAGSRFLIFASLWTPSMAAPPDPIGYWITGKDQAVVQIYSCREDVLCGALVGFPMNHVDDPMPKTWNHESQCRFVFVRNLRPREHSWVGTIIDPRNGQGYNVEGRITAPDQLTLRGYALLEMLGSTRFWTRYNGLPAMQRLDVPLRARFLNVLERHGLSPQAMPADH
jgi:uncharacterized protein (DUF2147 family)